MKISLCSLVLVVSGVTYACEPSPKGPKSDNGLPYEALAKYGARRAGTAIADGVDSALRIARKVESDSRCPKRSVDEWKKFSSEDFARRMTLQDLKVDQEVEFEDNSRWRVESNQYQEERDRVFTMRTVIYNNNSAVCGFPLWKNRIRERHRTGITRQGKRCDATKTTFRRLDREFTTAGYVAVAGIALVAAKLVWKILR